jgi:hypothetical protein
MKYFSMMKDASKYLLDVFHPLYTMTLLADLDIVYGQIFLFSGVWTASY